MERSVDSAANGEALPMSMAVRKVTALPGIVARRVEIVEFMINIF